MNDKFHQHVEALHAKYEALVGMRAVSLSCLPRPMPRSGIYVFYEGRKPLYVGRSKRLPDRLRYHCSATANDAPFAFKLAREATGKEEVTYRPKAGRKELLADPRFSRAFRRAKKRIREMDIKFVEEADPVRQALLEIYVTISLGARYNDFDTH